jgi:hypothetical protein
MAIYRLKTATKESMVQILKKALLTDSEGELITANHDYFLKVRGKLNKPTGVVIESDKGNYAEVAPIDGFHADIVTEDKTIIDSLSGIIISANNPLYKIAGEK